MSLSFRFCLALCASVLSSGWVMASSTLPVAAPPPSNYHFEVFLDGKAIGEHSFEFEPVEQGYRLESRASYQVKVLLIPFYEYSHVSNELWRQGCLHQISSTTDDNGKDYRVNGEEDGSTFIVSVNRETSALGESCVRTFAYWNPLLLDESALLNSQTGELDPVTFAEAGQTPLPWNSREQATTYELATPKGDITLWYTDQGRWLGLQSRLKGGRTLLYQPLKAGGGLK